MYLENVKKSKLIIEQHFHGAYGVDFANCTEKEVLDLSEKLLFNGIGGFFPTLATDTVENIKKQINIFKSAAKKQSTNSAKILGVHLEGIFLNPEKKGIHDESQFLELTIENFKKIEDDFIKIVTLAPELDKGFELIKYLKSKNIKVQAGHCTGGNLNECDGVTHLFNAMSPITHRNSSTSLSALINDNLYTEIIADGVHLSNDIINLTLKSKPTDKILLISDCLPITNSDKKEMEFCGKTIFYDGKKATDKNGTLAGSTTLLDKIIKRLLNMKIEAFKFIDNSYKYHQIDIDGCIMWNDKNEIIMIEKDGFVLSKKDYV
jgi:N-acetylglucosamine-6-phosphate deacetylase